MTDHEITMVFDHKLLRPACILLQVCFGCDQAREVLPEFNAETWLVAPTEAMVKITEKKSWWLKLAKKVNENHK